MLEKIEAVRDALEKECYLPALSLALTFPDICGQVEYPQYYYIDNKGRKINQTGKQYKNWFREYAEHYFADSDGWYEESGKAKNAYFTANMCWALRNSFLHSGNHETVKTKREDEDNDYLYKYVFELSALEVDSTSISWTNEPSPESGRLEKNVAVSLGVILFCERMCWSAEEYYNNKDKELFLRHEIKLVGINPKKKI